MSNIIAQSKSKHVVKVLRKNIIEGKFPAGMPLKSIRVLANEFGVGRQVIHSALQTLEGEKLVKSQPRRGYIAKGNPVHSSRGIYLLAFGALENHFYLNKILQMTSPLGVFHDYNLSTRLVSIQDATIPGMWEHELRNAEQVHGVDFLLVHSSRLTRKQIESTLRLSIPVIFLGDFESGCFPDLPICQVVENGSVQTPPLCLEYLQSQGCRKIAMLTFSNDAFYNRELSANAIKASDRLGQRLDILSLEDTGSLSTHEMIIDRYRQLVGKIPEDTDGLFLGGIHYPWLKEAMPNLTTRLKTISSGTHLNEIPHLESDFTPFHQWVHDLCEDYLKGGDISRRHIVNLNYRIVEP